MTLDLDTLQLPELPLTNPCDLVNARVQHYWPYTASYDEGKRRSYELKNALPLWAVELCGTWFFSGLGEVMDGETIKFRGLTLVPREGTLRENLNKISPFLGSWDPSHEQKTAMVGLLFYRLFKEA